MIRKRARNGLKALGGTEEDQDDKEVAQPASPYSAHMPEPTNVSTPRKNHANQQSSVLTRMKQDTSVPNPTSGGRFANTSRVRMWFDICRTGRTLGILITYAKAVILGACLLFLIRTVTGSAKRLCNRLEAPLLGAPYNARTPMGYRDFSEPSIPKHSSECANDALIAVLTTVAFAQAEENL